MLLRLRFPWLAAELLCLSVAAAAQEPPLLAPNRDVTVTYAVTRATADHVAHKLRLIYVARGPAIRVDSFVFPDGRTPFNTVLFDGAQAKRIIIVYQLQGYFEEDLASPDMPELIPDAAMHFTRGAPRTIAGLSCTDWQATSDRFENVTYCLTDDGIVLASDTKTRTLQATDVVPGVPADAPIAVPSDLRRLQARKPAAPNPE
jgi:hypothetical protein